MLILTREMRCKHFEPVDMLVVTKQRGGSWVCLCMRDTQQSLTLRYICPTESGFTSQKKILEGEWPPPKTTLTAFFLLFQNDAFANHYFMLTYPVTIHGMCTYLLYITYTIHWNNGNVVYKEHLSTAGQVWRQEMLLGAFIQCTLVTSNVTVCECCWM